jgi:methyltransferase
MDTRIAFTLLVLLVAAQRLLEMVISRRHERALKARGATEHAAEQMPWMVAVHTGWLVAMLCEVWLFEPRFQLGLAVPALLLFGLGQALRFSAMRALGERWTVRVLTLPEPAVTQGVFRHVRHPNYLGVVLEIAALPLVHGAFVTAVLFSAANGMLLLARVRAEERALAQSSDYDARFAGLPRFVPRREQT